MPAVSAVSHRSSAPATIVLHESFEMRPEVWRVIEQERCTVVLGVPTIWKLLMDAPQFATVNLDHVRWFISGGAPLPQYIIDAYQKRGVVFKQGYGMTEVGVNCFTMTVEDSFENRIHRKPLMFTESSSDVDNGKDDVGEIIHRGRTSPWLLDNEAATREAYGTMAGSAPASRARQTVLLHRRSPQRNASAAADIYLPRSKRLIPMQLRRRGGALPTRPGERSVSRSSSASDEELAST
jgi:acyl-CoA synthetase (AMP-forming)/AMP-acid ligase II